MIKINKFINQQGNATAICLIAMSFFLIIIAGTVFYNNSSVRASATSRDKYQSQYLAESGIKRVVDSFKFHNTNNSWSWLDNSGNTSNWQNGSNNPNEKYHISIYLTTAPTNLIIPSQQLDNDYLVIATGFCNGIETTMSAIVRVHLGGVNGNSPMFNFGFFSTNDITFYGTNLINSNFGANQNCYSTTATVNGGYSLTSNYSTISNNWKLLDSNISWPFVNFPLASTTYLNSNRPVLTKTDSSGNTINVNTVADMLALSKNQTIENKTIIINENLYLSDSTMQNINSLQLKNVSIFVNGEFGINTKKPVNINDNCLIVAKDRIFINDANNAGGAMYVSYNNIEIHNSTLNNGAFYANNITIQNSTINTSLNTVLANGFSGAPATGVTVDSWNISTQH